MFKYSVGPMIYQNTADHHIVGSTSRTKTSYVSGWCCVDLTERVSFDHYRGKLMVDIEGRKYCVKCRKHDAVRTAVKFLKCSETMIERCRIPDWQLGRAEIWQLDMWASPDGGWTENDRIRVGVIDFSILWDSRKICHLLREKGYLPPARLMKAHVSREYVDMGRLEICDKDGMPVLSVEMIEEV